MTRMAGDARRIETVLGPIDPQDAGRVMMHEHVLCNVTPPALAASGQPRVEVTLENVHQIRFHWTRHYGNHILDDPALMALELADFKEAGGGTIVDLTIRGIAPDPRGLADVSRASGTHIVAGTGYYISEFSGTELSGTSTDHMAERMIADLTEGFDGTSIKAGIIGEIGVSDPWYPDERRVMTAAAIAQKQTGATISVHPGRDPASPFQIIEHLQAEGADIQRVVIGHLDRTFTSPDQVQRLADIGCILEWDFFGIESSYYPFSDLDMPNDATRLALILPLLKAGYQSQIVISQDICTLTRLRRRGGHGYAHIMESVVPVMRGKGLSEEIIEQVLTVTPQRLLARKCISHRAGATNL